jgi:hypothetical protein
VVRLTGRKGRKVGNDSLGLNIWWNLNILRGALEGVLIKYDDKFVKFGIP